MGRYAYAESGYGYYNNQDYDNSSSQFSGVSYHRQQRISIKTDVTVDDIRPIAELIVENEMVILDLSTTQDRLHVIDTLAGVAYGCNSSVNSIAKNMYLITPDATVNVSIEDK
jgi:FtsZ-interacting cell division protein YlmF